MSLDHELTRWASAGWTISYRTPTTAVVDSPGAPVNHLIHLILTLLTCVWGIVWIIVAVTTPGARRLVLNMRPDGTIAVTLPNGQPADLGRRPFWRRGPGVAIIAVGVVLAVIVVLGAVNA